MQAQIIHPDPREEFYTDEGCYILESWNDPADPSLSIARARVRPGVSTRMHWLVATCERYLIISGTGRVQIADLPEAPVAAGDVVVIPPDAHQRITNTGADDLIFYALCTPRFTQTVYRDAAAPQDT